MPDPASPPLDQAARDRIAADLDSTLFVEAGAGSGKTTALVDRVVALVTSGAAELANIAAITFTDKAAVELRDRVRSALERTADADPGGEEGRRCRVALDQLDGAAIGTLHTFAQRILTEHPVEAGLPPKVEVLDEISSGVEFERRWATFQDALLADTSLERTILLLLACGAKAAALRSLAAAFDDNWDLVAERVVPDAAEPPPVAPMLGAVLAELDELCARRDRCRKAGTDGLALRLDDLAAYARRLRSLDGDVELLEALDPDKDVSGAPSFNVGRTSVERRNWDLDLGASGRRSGTSATDCRRCATGSPRRAPCGWPPPSARFTLAAAGERRDAGRLEFHDLLVLARSLLRDPEHGPAVRARLHARYQRLLLDEFQDTDPIQIELAVLIAAADPEAAATGAAPWDAVPVAPGRLFVVGDPKQSIYRFRRADISVFLAAERRFAPDGGGVVELTTNFRTGDQVIAWVNDVFGSLMAPQPGDDDEATDRSQPDYRPLDAVRPFAAGGCAGLGHRPSRPPAEDPGRRAPPRRGGRRRRRGRAGRRRAVGGG